MSDFAPNTLWALPIHRASRGTYCLPNFLAMRLRAEAATSRNSSVVSVLGGALLLFLPLLDDVSPRFHAAAIRRDLRFAVNKWELRVRSSRPQSRWYSSL
jgi:hypothetical protein